MLFCTPETSLKKEKENDCNQRLGSLLKKKKKKFL